VGDNKNKGIGVFARKGNRISQLYWQGQYTLKGVTNNNNSLSWQSEKLQSFLPFTVNDTYSILAIWTKQAGSPNFRYIGQLWKYLQIHKNQLSADNTILCGDLNSNAIWDEPDRWWNHSDVVRELKEIKLRSLYHYIEKEDQGKESKKTFFMYRNYEKSYHIDYLFMSSNLLPSSTLKIHEQEPWMQCSDHVPLEFILR